MIIKTLLALLLLIPSISFADTWCGSKKYKDNVWKQKSGWCGWDAEKIDRPADIDYEKGPVSMSSDGRYYYGRIKKTELLSTSNNNSSSKVSNTNKQELKANEIDKNELKEQLKYWKSLLDDELISQKDYDYKKDVLLNSLGSEKKVLKTTNSNNTSTSNSNTASNNNLASDLDGLMNTSNSNSNTSSSKSKCAGLNADKNWGYKALTGYFSKKEACLKIASYSDDELCSKIERGKDRTLNPYENHYKKEASSRGVACIDGIAFDKSDSTTKILQSQKKLEEKMEKKMACTARRTEWKTLCKTGDYRMVNGVMCFSSFRC